MSSSSSESPLYNKKILSFQDLISLSAEKAFQKFYQVKSKVLDYKNARDWWEPSSAITQCNNTVGTWKVAHNADEPCYICGLPLKNDTHTNECEHVLPVYQATLLLALYKSKEQKGTPTPTPGYYQEVFDLEYKWAHSCCNQVKSDISFLDFNDKKRIFQLHVNNTRTILSKIWDGTHKQCTDKTTLQVNIRRTFNNKNAFIKNRMTVIGDVTINPIIDFLHKKITKTESIGLYYLTMISSVLASVDQKQMALAKGSIIREPPNFIAIKQSLYIGITDFIIQSFKSGENITVTELEKVQKLLHHHINSMDIAIFSTTNTNTNFIKAKLSKYLLCDFHLSSSYDFPLSHRMIFFDTFVSPLYDGEEEKKKINISIYAFMKSIIKRMEKNSESVTTSSQRSKRNIDTINFEDLFRNIKSSLELESFDEIYIDEYIDCCINNDISLIIKYYSATDKNDLYNQLLQKRVQFFQNNNINYETITDEEEIENDLTTLEISGTLKFLKLLNDVNDEYKGKNNNEDIDDSLIIQLADTYHNLKGNIQSEINNVSRDASGFINNMVQISDDKLEAEAIQILSELKTPTNTSEKFLNNIQSTVIESSDDSVIEEGTLSVNDIEESQEHIAAANALLDLGTAPKVSSTSVFSGLAPPPPPPQLPRRRSYINNILLSRPTRGYGGNKIRKRIKKTRKNKKRKKSNTYKYKNHQKKRKSKKYKKRFKKTKKI